MRIPEKIVDANGEIEVIHRFVDTTVGRALLSEILPNALPFSCINKTLTKKEVSALINMCYHKAGLKDTVIFADQLMYTGFAYATRSGISLLVWMTLWFQIIRALLLPLPRKK